MKEIKTLKDYQELANWACSGKTFEASDDVKDISHELAYNVIGLTEEAGEVAGKIKKAIRRTDLDRFSEEFSWDPSETLKIIKELGDTLYYLARIADMIGSSLEEVANIHKIKLEDRHQRGVVEGEGDER